MARRKIAHLPDIQDALPGVDDYIEQLTEAVDHTTETLADEIAQAA